MFVCFFFLGECIRHIINDDVSSMDNSNDLCSSSEEDINNENDRLKIAQGNGTNGSSVRYGDYRLIEGGGESSVRKGGVGSSASSPLKRGGGGTFLFEDPFASLRELHANSAQCNNPRDAKNEKDKFQRICKKFFSRRVPKYRCILLLILGMVALGLFVLFCAKLYIQHSDCGYMQNVHEWKEFYSFLKNNSPYPMVAHAVFTAGGILILIAFLGYNYYKARKKYIKKKKTEF
ncbi:hypothetical protein, conserved in P.knowlesi (fragment) [Plasmodium knowlesi strain H]|uniref:Fam-m protein n=3 Tax=Plasmodium knowlesi TaxID=5850 RepID=A0A5E7X506_PLAKH